jgi:hypothetical protein
MEKECILRKMARSFSDDRDHYPMTTAGSMRGACHRCRYRESGEQD